MLRATADVKKSTVNRVYRSGVVLRTVAEVFGTTRSNSTIRGDFLGSTVLSADCFIVSSRLGDWFSDRAAYNDIYVT